MTIKEKELSPEDARRLKIFDYLNSKSFKLIKGKFVKSFVKGEYEAVLIIEVGDLIQYDVTYPEELSGTLTDKKLNYRTYQMLVSAVSRDLEKFYILTKNI